jgi:hypothetical protein
MKNISTSNNKPRKINEQGYATIFVPNHPNANKEGYVLEHRFVVELKIGRFLKTEEVVHHIDENKLNNSIVNLMPFHSQKEHQSFHIKVKKYGFTNPIMKQINERWENFK